MSPGPADQVNAKELAARAAVVERRLDLARLKRVQEAGGLPGTCVNARLRFGTFEGRTTVDVAIEGIAALRCQRCLQPCECAIDESAQLMVVRDEDEELPGGYEPVIGSPEHVSLVAVIEEQVLLALPLVPMHADSDDCRPTTDAESSDESREDRQRPFANLRELIDRRRS